MSLSLRVLLSTVRGARTVAQAEYLCLWEGSLHRQNSGFEPWIDLRNKTSMGFIAAYVQVETNEELALEYGW